MNDITLTAEFSEVEETTEGEDVLLSGRLFQAGDYPDKKFNLSPRELLETIKQFVSPKPMDLEHETMRFGEADLTGQFGAIEHVWPSEDGEWIMARVRKPTWLHQVMPETRVSATFTRDDKELIGAAWTSTPRVDGAELVAAFASKHNTPSGQAAMQHLHDASVQRGAVCSKPGTASMASRHESKGIQEIHDTAASHGAKCEDASSPDAPNASPLYGMFTEGEQPTKQTPARRTRMTLIELLKSLGKNAGVEISDDEIRSEFAAPAKAEADELRKQLEAERAERERLQSEAAVQFAAIVEERRTSAAVTFANSQVEAKRITPESATAVAALHARLTASDATASFAEGEKSTTALFEEFLGQLPDLSLFTKTEVPANTVVLSTASATVDPTAQATDASQVDPAKIAKLMAMTAVGQQALKSKKA